MNLPKYAIFTREVCYIDKDILYNEYQVGKNKQTSAVAVVNIAESDDVLYNVLKISCDTLAQYIDYGVKSSLIEYLSDDSFQFKFEKDRITIQVPTVGYTIIMWTLLDHSVRVSKSGENGIIETRKEDLYFI